MTDIYFLQYCIYTAIIENSEEGNKWNTRKWQYKWLNMPKYINPVWRENEKISYRNKAAESENTMI